MEWMFLSLLSAFGQAFGWALKKRALENKGVNNTIGLVTFAVAGSVLGIAYWIFGEGVNALSVKFWFASVAVVGLNIIAVWTAYQALDKAALSQLMPFIALTALAIVPIEYALRDVLPTIEQTIGIVLVVVGAVIFAIRQKPSREAIGAAGYFAVTIACYSVASPLMAVAVTESGSGLFSAAVFHLGIAIGFLPLALFTGEQTAIRWLQREKQWARVVWTMILAGLVIAFLENGPVTIALESATASEVFAIKRTMPFFALILGIIMFGEKVTRRHVVGTAFLVLGSILIVSFR